MLDGEGSDTGRIGGFIIGRIAGEDVDDEIDFAILDQSFYVRLFVALYLASSNRL